jgi:DNA-binding MarR family transcriptional regulator
MNILGGEVSEIGVLRDINFFHPTSLLKELILLESIENNKNTTQKELANHVNVVPSMINQYIKNLEENLYLYKDIKSSRNVFYFITEKGIERKNYLLMTYLNELLQLYNLAKENFELVFKRIEEHGSTELILYGAGEVAETVIALINGRNNSQINIKAILDDDEEKQGHNLFCYKIINPQNVAYYKNDIILITSFTYEQQIIEKLKYLNFPKENIISLFRKHF